MNYPKTVDFLFSMLPMYQRTGDKAFKKDLTNIISLCKSLENPHNSLKTIHVAGTNGKGSVTHLLASILMENGYKVGFYTSPHLYSFRERIKINGTPISKEYVVDFVEKIQEQITKIQPSFFEITVAMAFDYFKYKNVDFAVIETGLGGRLDSTNIINPIISIITNISLEHENMLGNSLTKIALEKAGIIKHQTPVVIGKKQPEIKKIFEDKANEKQAEIFFAEDYYKVQNYQSKNGISEVRINNTKYTADITGTFQQQNIITVLKSVDVLSQKIAITQQSVFRGIQKVKQNTSFRGRWEIVKTKPTIVYDVAHNIDAIKYHKEQLKYHKYDKLHIVLGMSKDKNADDILSFMPTDAIYYYCRPNVPRGLSVKKLRILALQNNLKGHIYCSVVDALMNAKYNASENDLILVTGSVFVVSEVI